MPAAILLCHIEATSGHMGKCQRTMRKQPPKGQDRQSERAARGHEHGESI